MLLRGLLYSGALLVSLLLNATASGADLSQSATGGSGYCVDYTNVGGVPGILGLVNSCGTAATVEVRNRNSAGRIVVERTFHLNRGEERRVGLPGFATSIVDVQPEFVRGNFCEDGSRFVRLSSRTVSNGQYVVFSVRNLSSDRYLAVKVDTQMNSRTGTTWWAVPPGQTNDRLWGAFPNENPQMTLQWACLDPH